MDKIYKIRTSFIFFIFCLLYFFITFNLYLIQIQQNDFFVKLGKNQYDVTITMNPERSPIFDRTGKQFLALSKDSLSAFILPKQLKSPKKLSAFLKNHFPEAYNRLLESKDNYFMFIKRKLTPDQIILIENCNIEDINLLNEPSRFYVNESAGPIVGITDIDNNGLFGIELQYNNILAGKPSVFSLKKDARSGYFYFQKETRLKGKTGKPIILTIDSALQFLAYEELEDAMKKHEAKEGSVIVMDPSNGDILAMVNSPCFDPNNTQKLDMQTSKNKIITESYELGSVIKVFAALAAVEEKMVTPDELIDCKNTKTTYIDGRKINTVKPHGLITFSEVIEKSNNIGIAIVAKRLDKKIYDHYKKIGFGIKTNIEFPGEQEGFVNPPTKWSKQSIISLSYGYEISNTLLQIACAFCMIARDGIKVQPRLILSPKTSTQYKEKRIYSKESIDVIKQIMENTTLKGTAKKAKINGYKVMSKTGTANLIVNGKYSPNDNIFTLAGIIEKANYQRVIIVFLKEIKEKNVYAQTIAAPLFEKIAEKTLIHDKII